MPENGLRFLMRPASGLSTGLFLDMRETRARSGAPPAAGAASSTCSPTPAPSAWPPTAGGATRVLNLDAARPALRWGMENYALNGLAADPYDFVYGDAFDWLGRLARREQPFDVVIADPPSFSSVKGRRFAAARDYARAGRRLRPRGGARRPAVGVLHQ